MGLDSIASSGGFGALADPLDVFGGRSAKKAAQKAEAAKKAAYDALKGLDSAAMDKAALEQARKNYLDQMGFAKEFSPGAYAGYEAGDDAMKRAADTFDPTFNKLLAGTDASYRENLAMQPGLSASEKLAADQSAELLAQGGALSPEQQAEFMRAGLAATSASGGVMGSTAQRSGMARQLASDQLRMQQARQSMAGNLQNQSNAIRQQRNANLNAMLGTQGMPMNFATNYAAGTGAAMQERIPQGLGIGGDTAASNYVSNINLENQKTLGKAGATVEGINAQYNASRAPIRGMATIAGGLLGGLAGQGGAGAQMGQAATAN